jgi:hypothetical protein
LWQRDYYFLLKFAQDCAALGWLPPPSRPTLGFTA